MGQQPKAAVFLQSVLLHACCLNHHGFGISDILVSLIQFRFHHNRFTQLPFSFSFGESSPVAQMAFWNLKASLCDQILAVSMPANTVPFMWTLKTLPGSAIKLTCCLTAFYCSYSSNVFFDGFRVWGNCPQAFASQQKIPVSCFIKSVSLLMELICTLGLPFGRDLALKISISSIVLVQPLKFLFCGTYFYLKYYSPCLCTCLLLNFNQVGVFSHQIAHVYLQAYWSLQHFPQHPAHFSMFLFLILFSSDCHSKHLLLLPRPFLYSHQWQQLAHPKIWYFFGILELVHVFIYFSIEMHNQFLKHLCFLNTHSWRLGLSSLCKKVQWWMNG